MKTRSTPPLARTLGVLFLPAILVAQVAPPPPPDAATLARYDRNQNGRLDPDELRAAEADRSKATSAAVPSAPGSTAGTSTDVPITLSPFEVVADARGYQATNTMSGTRLNSQLEDLGASISVITKEQMADLAMLDINDVFLYTGNTEGTGQFTQIDEVSGRGETTDATAGDPANANRIRGIGTRQRLQRQLRDEQPRAARPARLRRRRDQPRAPTRASSAWATHRAPSTSSARRPICSATARPISFRADSFDGWRSSIDLNRVLLKDRLAIRVSGAQGAYTGSISNHPESIPSVSTPCSFRRSSGRCSALPTSITKPKATRPNSIPPQDGVTAWREAGSQTWDPLTSSLKLNGVVTRTTPPPTPMCRPPTTASSMSIARASPIGAWSFGATGGTSPFGALQARLRRKSS
jgi:hypothetical protein